MIPALRPVDPSTVSIYCGDQKEPLLPAVVHRTATTIAALRAQGMPDPVIARKMRLRPEVARAVGLRLEPVEVKPPKPPKPAPTATERVPWHQQVERIPEPVESPALAPWTKADEVAAVAVEFAENRESMAAVTRGAIRTIQRAVAFVCKIPAEAMLSPRRAKEWAVPRQIAMAIALDRAPRATTTTVGRAFGGRDHTTVMHAVKTTAKRRASSPEFAALYERARAAAVGELAR